MLARQFLVTAGLAAATIGCGGSHGASPATTSSLADEPGPAVVDQAGPDPAGGPRPITATLVDLDVDAFPRPAAEACAGITSVVEVAAGGSIAAALEEAGPGTLVNLEAGTYVERPDEWVALEIGTNDLCLRAMNGPAVLEAASGQTAGIILTADRVVVEGLVLRGFEVGIAIDGRPGETQQGLTIERTKIEDPSGDFREGIIVVAEPVGSEVVLDGLLVSGVVIDGIDLGVSCNVGPCDHIWIDGTSISGRTSSDDSGADAFAIEEGQQIVVVDTVVSGMAADGIDTKASDVVVSGCRVLDVGRNGIKLWRGGDVINTIIDGTGADASLVGEEPGTYRYIHTLVAHHGDPGETPYVGTWSYDRQANGVAIEIVNSIFYENSPGGLFVTDGAELSIRNSIFTGASGHRLVQIGEDLSYLFSDLATFGADGLGANNLLADPEFVDLSAGDYSTGPTSPARDAGEPISGLESDATGQARERGTAPDIGPIES